MQRRGCWHCGEPLPADVAIHAHVAGHARPMCCQGCRAAAEWIEQLGLGDYYRLRTQPAQKPDRNTANGNRDAWQRPELARHVIRDLGKGCRETMLLIEGVRCAACVWLIERSLGALPGVASVQVNAAAQRGRIIWHDAMTTLPRILDQLARTGYPAHPLHAATLDDVRRRESRDALKRLLVAGLGAMQAMMFAAVLYVGSSDLSANELFGWLGFLVTTPVVFYSARPFFAGAVRSIKARQLGIDVPVAAAVTLIYAASLVEAVRGGGHVYFDSVSMFVFFLLAGRYLQMRARHRCSDLTDALARLTPPFAKRLLPDGTLERVGIQELAAGDRVCVEEGGRLPADGILLSERCRVDEALLSGESAPLTKRHAEPLVAGSVLLDGPIHMRVERVGAETMLAGIVYLVERAQAQRPQLAHAGERTARSFVARLFVLTALTAAVWSVLDPSRAFSAALAVLVVSCPCAFALAVPAAITRALAVLARCGVLVVKPDAIQALAEATHVVFDKTGTLSEPELALSDVKTFDGLSCEAALSLAASLGRESQHPVARAIAAARGNRTVKPAHDVTSYAGLGLSGNVARRELRLGQAAFALPEASRSSDDVVLLADAAGPVASFRLRERLRPDARAAMDALRQSGLRLMIVSGDAPTNVASVAVELKISDWHARQVPADKLNILSRLRANGACVIAVGDGVNDAPVLAGADVAIAVAGGAEIARASSDVVLTGGRLMALATARRIAKQTLAILRQNQRWALFYNLAAVPAAALGLVPPWLAALGMSLSSLAVILNALRIGRGVRDPAAGEAEKSALGGPGVAAA